MKLYELLKQENIFLQKKFKDKYEVINFLVDQLYQNGDISNKEEILNLLLEREKISTSGVNDQIAVPHIRVDNIDNFISAFCTLKPGVNFESLDKQDVTIVLLLIAPKTMAKEYLNLLAKFSRIFKKEENRAKVLSLTSPEEVINFIKSQEE